MHGVDASAEDERGEVAGARVQGRTRNDKTDDGDDFGDGRVPRAFIHSACTHQPVSFLRLSFLPPSLEWLRTGIPSKGNGDGPSNNVRWAHESQSDVATVSEGVEDGGEEILEVGRRHVDLSREHKEPHLKVLAGVEKTLPGGGVVAPFHRVDGHPIVSKLPFLRREPARGERLVGEEEGRDHGHSEGDDALDDEHPPPACEPGFA